MIDLTEKLKKGELPYAEYYIKLGGGEYTNDVWDVDGWQSFNKEGDVVAEVLAPVPSYEEWKEYQELEEDYKKNVQLAIRFSIEADILKELLKECKTPLKVYNEMFGNKEELLTKIDEVLK